jgi:aminoglycoside phosphotransferase
VRAGLVDEWDFDDERQGRKAADVLAEVEASRVAGEQRALTHGDPCLPNAIFDGAAFSGFIDCSRAGVADPYQDLALAARSL